MSRKKACKQCPFNKKAGLTADDLGGSSPFVYIGQSHGPFWLPCHMDRKYTGSVQNAHEVGQCAGAAIYRSNIGRAELMPKGIMILPEDKENVFEDHAEFLSHYSGNDKGSCERLLEQFTPEGFMESEMRKSAVKRVGKVKI